MFQINKIYTVLGNIGLFLLFLWLTHNFLINFNAEIDNPFSITELLVYNVVFSSLMMFVALINQFFLFPEFLSVRKYKKYILFLSLTLAITSIAMAGLDWFFLRNLEIAWVLSPGHWISRIPHLLILVAIVNWFGMSAEVHKRRLKEEELLKIQSQSELKWLLAQLNPHFLFNTINNIHSLIQLGSDKASPALVKLSDLLKYVIYKGDKETITIADEIDHIHDFLDLSLLKERWKPKVFINEKIEDQRLRLAPLLLINFIENALKHGNLDDKDAYIKIKVHTTTDSLDFQVENSFIAHTNKDKTQGIGLENIKKRLQLIYPELHRLKIIEDDERYKVHLHIKELKNYE